MGLLSRLQRDHMHACELYVSDEGRRMDLKSILGALGVDVQVYACGPGRLIDALENIAAEWPEGRRRYEHFSSAGGALDPSKEHRFSVRLADSGIELTVAADQSLLETLQTAGIDIPCDCGEGLCGTCEVAVIDGDIDHRDKVLSKSERAENRRMMACCSRARGDKITLAL